MKLKTIHFLPILIMTLILSNSAWAEQIIMHKVSADSEETVLLALGNPCNPCASKTANPCASNTCNPCNPCAGKASNPCGTNPCNPCAGKTSNPCGANPCNPCAAASNQTNASDRVDPKKIKRPSWFTSLYNKDSRADLVAYGEQLFNDTTLGSNSIKCTDCHAGSNLFNESFLEPYPHKVSMAKQRAGLDTVHADEFVQFCINVPLAGESLPWKSKKLAALTAYVLDVAQPAYIEKVQGVSMTTDNPCAKNPCAGKASNPCGVNPCNPCAANPCNPCAGTVLAPSSLQ